MNTNDRAIREVGEVDEAERQAAEGGERAGHVSGAARQAPSPKVTSRTKRWTSMAR
ncbi:hypothetical protein [Streptomyces sp. NPDC050388]|uniref:hypothetical protein n=1 Tax=Streptomyces sp. NPDC050388 TaxID=3155781 RepID=UPI0034148A6D